MKSCYKVKVEGRILNYTHYSYNDYCDIRHHCYRKSLQKIEVSVNTE